MTHNYHKESLAKFPLPSHPDEENYITHEEFSEAMKEYHDGWAAAHEACKRWVRWEQVKDACHSAEAARAQAKADRLCYKATEQAKKQV